ncbi:MAG TPA: hypothetical protein G4O13_04755 [Dehalococcoidia bacterium]|nr:hypothetical protein [Dehalococcoidia bacterium]
MAILREHKVAIAILLALLLLILAALPVAASPLAISAVETGNVTETSATITWTTDVPADSVVNYGTTPSLGLTASDATLVTNHSITLNDLVLGTTYYYEVQSTDGWGNTTTDDNAGDYYKIRLYKLTGWGWCTDYTEIASAEFVANGVLVPRDGTPEVSDVHLVGNVTLTLSDDSTENIALNMWGSKVRSLFQVRQSAERKSAHLWGVWLTWDSSEYISGMGEITLPEGEVFETAKLYVLQLKTPDVIIQNKEPGSFVEDLEYLITKFTKFMDDLIDELMLTDFAEVLGDVLAKLMVLLAEVRGMVGPYIP